MRAARRSQQSHQGAHHTAFYLLLTFL
jgi:hypothetical protein